MHLASRLEGDGGDETEFINRECEPSPIAVDVLGNGFSLTNVQGGVQFDLVPGGTPERIAWTSRGSDDAWLVLDRNENGAIDDGTELFGNYTPQSATAEPNGFVALGEFDEADLGGNEDGVVSSADEVFHRLRLWRDDDHNGASEPRSRRVDEHDNEFRFVGRVIREPWSRVGPFAVDIFLAFE